jgi:hypothetical protein
MLHILIIDHERVIAGRARVVWEEGQARVVQISRVGLGSRNSSIVNEIIVGVGNGSRSGRWRMGRRSFSRRRWGL